MRKSDYHRMSKRPLNRSEFAIWKLIAYGYVSHVIARKTGLSKRTVETYRHRLHVKLGQHTPGALGRLWGEMTKAQRRMLVTRRAARK